MLKLIDSHCHLNFEGFCEDRDLILEQTLEAGIGVINIGSQYETSLEAVDLAEKNEKGVWAAAGLHPIHIGKRIRDEAETKFQEEIDKEGPEKVLEKIKELLSKKSDKIIGIGETGLDYYLPRVRAEQVVRVHLPEGKEEEIKEKQADFFRRQIFFAAEKNLPLIIHCRDAYEDLIKILKQEKVNRGVVHCFSGTLKQAKEILNLGLFLGFTGIITFKNALDIQEVVKRVPLDKILVETDAPYLAPEPHRGERNLPAYVIFVAKKIAELKGLPEKKVFKKTLENTIGLFNLKI